MDFRRTTLILILLAGLAGCVREGALREPHIEPLADGIFMVPVNRDAEGCVRYRMISDRARPDYTVYWRVQAGHFTNNRTSADCRPRETSQ